MTTWKSGFTITITGDGGEVFAVHHLGPDESTHLIVALQGREAVEEFQLDMDRFGDRGAEDTLDDIQTACMNVIRTAKEEKSY